MVTASLKIKNRELSYMTRDNNGTGRLTEALYLEGRAPRFEMKGKKPPLNALNPKRNVSASYPRNNACTVKHFHRRSRSLDLNIGERLVLSPLLYDTCSMGTIYCSQKDNPHVYTQSSLQLESNRKDCRSFQDLHSARAGKLRERFQGSSFTTLLCRETESECDSEATGPSTTGSEDTGSAIADESPFVMKLSSPTSAVEEEKYITAFGLVQPMSISFNQKQSKRERNKLKSMQRKQRRRERWLQKQVGV